MFFVGQWQKWEQTPSVQRRSLEAFWAMPFSFLGETASKREAFVSHPFT